MAEHKEKVIHIPSSILKAENISFNDPRNQNQDLSSNVQNALAEILTGEITEEDIFRWYNEIGEEDTGISNIEIDAMYDDDKTYEEDTGVRNIEIDAMYDDGGISFEEDVGISNTEIDALY